MKGINHKYIILQRSKLKIFLKAGSEPWEAPIGHKWYQIDVWLESLFAAWIFDYGYTDYTEKITSYLAVRYNIYVRPVHAQHFIEYFKASHKIEKLNDCSLKDVFLLGDDIDGCPVPIYKYDCAITKEDEQMLLKKVQDNPAASKKMLKNFFSMHMTRFNQSYYPRRNAKMEAECLAENFLAMHGIRLANKTNEQMSDIADNNKYGCWVVIGYLVFLIIIPFIVTELCYDTNRELSRFAHTVMFLAVGGIAYFIQIIKSK